MTLESELREIRELLFAIRYYTSWQAFQAQDLRSALERLRELVADLEEGRV